MPQTYMVKGEAEASPVRAFLAVPSYGGLEPSFVASLYGSQYALRAAGIPATLDLLTGHCHVDDSRNVLVRDFLESDCTDLVFLDSDVGWQAQDLVRLLLVDRDIVAGVYPLKQSPQKFPIRPIPGEIWSESDGCVEVEGVPTGFLRIRRHVLEALYAPSNKFLGQAESLDRKPIGIIFERTYEDGQRFGGDYSFCRKAKAAGFKVHVLPDMAFEHTGAHVWRGSLGAFWRREHGVTEANFIKGLEAIRKGTETPADIAAMCEHWGNIPWAAGAGLVETWVLLAREARGAILECGAGLTTLLAAAANPGVTVYALEHDDQWAARIRGAAETYGIPNVRIVRAPLVDRWYAVPHDLPRSFGLVLVDGPPRDISDRGRVAQHLDLSLATVVWDDLDQTTMTEMVEAVCAEYGATPHIINHPTKNFAIARMGRRLLRAAE